MWKFGFTAIEYAEEQGEALWPNAVSEGYNPYEIGLDWYGMRVAQMCDIWKSVWGADANRVICVMGTQAANTSVAPVELNCSLWSGAPCTENHGISVLAIAPYFGYTVPDSWTTQPDGGLTDLFTEVNSGGLAPGGYPGGMIKQVIDWTTAEKAIADSYGLQLVGYEDGPGFVDSNDATTTPLYIAANSDPRMGTAVTSYLNQLKAVGMTQINYFSLAATYSKWGSWGALENIMQTNTPKYDAITAFVANNPCWWNGCTPAGIPDTRPPSTPTNLSATEIASYQINLTWATSTDNVEVTGYEVFRNGTQITTTVSPSYSDTCLTASTNYSYTIKAFDAAGNVSPASSAASATTGSGGNGAGCGGTTKVIYLTSGTTWTVPSDWNSSNNSIELIGGGAGGSDFTSGNPPNSGGGGGEYRKLTNQTYTAGHSITLQIGQGGAAGSAGTASFVYNDSNSSIVGQANGGSTPANYYTGGAGGTGGTGGTGYSGGTGGIRRYIRQRRRSRRRRRRAERRRRCGWWRWCPRVLLGRRGRRG